jgi:NAD(P)-dependent dehydrogenase (short-subunit alcohol dehydrogenase family)
MSFAGKQAIVTGAGSGIGAALCRALVNAGAEVVCTDIDGDAAERTATALNARSARLDVTDADGVQAAVDEVVNRAGRLIQRMSIGFIDRQRAGQNRSSASLS